MKELREEQERQHDRHDRHEQHERGREQPDGRDRGYGGAKEQKQQQLNGARGGKKGKGRVLDLDAMMASYTAGRPSVSSWASVMSEMDDELAGAGPGAKAVAAADDGGKEEGEVEEGEL